MKTQHNLSGIYFRSQNQETGKFENIVFEDLPESEQDLILATKSPEWIRELAKMLAKTLYEVAEECGIYAE